MLRQVAEFNFSDHELSPGQPVFSTVVNVCLSGDRSNWEDIPATSAFGRLFHILPSLPQLPYPQQAFPDVGAVYRHFSASRKNRVSKEHWGTASLTIPTVHWPSKPPIQCAYEIRVMVFARWHDCKLTPEVLSEMAQMSLLEFLGVARSTELSPTIALALAMETMNAMAKTVPVLPKHIQGFVRKILNFAWRLVVNASSVRWSRSSACT
jgi:hypothetical protein